MHICRRSFVIDYCVLALWHFGLIAASNACATKSSESISVAVSVSSRLRFDFPSLHFLLLLLLLLLEIAILFALSRIADNFRRLKVNCQLFIVIKSRANLPNKSDLLEILIKIDGQFDLRQMKVWRCDVRKLMLHVLGKLKICFWEYIRTKYMYILIYQSKRARQRR